MGWGGVVDDNRITPTSIKKFPKNPCSPVSLQKAPCSQKTNQNDCRRLLGGKNHYPELPSDRAKVTMPVGGVLVGWWGSKTTQPSNPTTPQRPINRASPEVLVGLVGLFL